MTTRRVFLFEYLSACPQDGSDAGLLAEGLAMRDALQRDLAAVPGVVVSVAEPGLLPRPVGERELAIAVISRLALQARRHDLVWVIAPETGGLLAALHDAVPPHQWIGCNGTAIRLATSKQATLACLHAHGIATPLDFADDARVRHWVVKPDDGAGSVSTRRFADRDAAQAEWLQREQRGECASLEAWVDGDALSLSLLLSHVGVELLAVNRQRLVIDAAGAVSLIEVVIAVPDIDARQRAALEQTARAVCAAMPGLAAWVGIDLVWHAERGPVVIEVNPRVTSAYVGMSKALGRNLAAEVLAAHATARPERARADVAY